MKNRFAQADSIATALTRTGLTEEAEFLFQRVEQVVGLLRNSNAFAGLGPDVVVKIDIFKKAVDKFQKAPFSVDLLNLDDEHLYSALTVELGFDHLHGLPRIDLGIYPNELVKVLTPLGTPKIYLRPMEEADRMIPIFAFFPDLVKNSIGRIITDGGRSTPPTLILSCKPSNDYFISPLAINALEQYHAVVTQKR